MEGKEDQLNLNVHLSLSARFARVAIFMKVETMTLDIGKGAWICVRWNKLSYVLYSYQRTCTATKYYYLRSKLSVAVLSTYKCIFFLEKREVLVLCQVLIFVYGGTLTSFPMSYILTKARALVQNATSIPN
jgi:hypothetical protein